MKVLIARTIILQFYKPFYSLSSLKVSFDESFIHLCISITYFHIRYFNHNLFKSEKEMLFLRCIIKSLMTVEDGKILESILFNLKTVFSAPQIK